jgi:predicted lipid carrier protein YhbT
VQRLQRSFVAWVARRVGAMPRARLERAMRAPRRRRAVLWAFFRAMPRAVRRRALERERAVIEWHLTGRTDGKPDVRQLLIEDGAAADLDGQPREPDLTLSLDAVDFLLLATGNAPGTALFVEGRIDVDGDPWLAMRLPRLFALGGGSGGHQRTGG